MTVIVHHLNNSRSQRILWMLEEMGVPYEVRHYQRDAKTMRAPKALKDIHPLGKSPVIEDTENGAVIAFMMRLPMTLRMTGPRLKSGSLSEPLIGKSTSMTPLRSASSATARRTGKLAGAPLTSSPNASCLSTSLLLAVSWPSGSTL